MVYGYRAELSKLLSHGFALVIRHPLLLSFRHNRLYEVYTFGLWQSRTITESLQRREEYFCSCGEAS